MFNKLKIWWKNIHSTFKRNSFINMIKHLEDRRNELQTIYESEIKRGVPKEQLDSLALTITRYTIIINTLKVDLEKN